MTTNRNHLVTAKHPITNGPDEDGKTFTVLEGVRGVVRGVINANGKRYLSVVFPWVMTTLEDDREGYISEGIEMDCLPSDVVA